VRTEGWVQKGGGKGTLRRRRGRREVCLSKQERGFWNGSFVSWRGKGRGVTFMEKIGGGEN